MTARTARVAWLGAGACTFSLLAILNCGGYRYGVADQAFYIPAILGHLDPSLFPYDRPLLNAQDQLLLFPRLAAVATDASGLSLPTLFLLGYLAILVLLFGGVVRIGRICYESWWTVAALALVLTLRHRITQTGVNTLEAYFHPRMLAFAVGIWSLPAFLKGNDLRALALVGLVGLLHPTTGVWFGVSILAGLIVSKGPAPRDIEGVRPRTVLIAAVLATAAAVLWAILFGPLRSLPLVLIRMDPEWASVLAGKDYVFPSDWGPSFWLVNFGYLACILSIYRYRVLHRRTLPREDGLVAGACALVILFLLSWPLASARIALIIQLQVSRIFWMLDFLAAVYLVWLAVEGPWGKRPPEGGRHDPIRSVRLQPDGTRAAVRRSVVAAMAVLAVARGGYVMWIEHAGAPIVRMNLEPGNWTDVMGWIARTSKGARVLADPGHVYKYGSSVRVAGQRDVCLEEVTDTAIAMYSRESAIRVLERIRDLENFEGLTADTARTLADKYDLDYLVVDRPLRLPVAYKNARFWVYTVGGP